VDLALVDVVAGSIVDAELEARIAAAFVGAPIVDAAMLAQARIFLALVDVNTFTVVVRVVLEAGLAVTAIGADAVDAFRVGGARPAVLIEFALVDVLAVLIVGGDKSCGTNASISARLVLTCLLRTANRLSRRALIDVNALRFVGVQLKSSLTVDRVDAAESAVGVDAFLTSRARISHLALVDVFIVKSGRRSGKG
jgi:hypothetical protein